MAQSAGQKRNSFKQPSFVKKLSFAEKLTHNAHSTINQTTSSNTEQPEQKDTAMIQLTSNTSAQSEENEPVTSVPAHIKRGRKGVWLWVAVGQKEKHKYAKEKAIEFVRAHDSDGAFVDWHY